MRQQLLNLIETIPQPALAAEPDLTLAGANRPALGLLPGLCPGQSLQPLFPGTDMLDCAARLQQGQQVTLTAPLISPVRLVLVPLGGPDAPVLGWLSPEAQELPQSPEAALSAFSHVFRQPLSEMFGMLAVVGNHLHANEDDSCDSYLNQVFRSGYRMLRTFSNLTELYNYHNGAYSRPAEAPVDIWALTLSLCRSAGVLTEASGIPITYDLPAEPCPVLCRQELFATAFSNLIANSCSYTREGNAIHVTGRTTASGVVITVSDRGLGIPDEVQPRVYEPFYSFDPDGAPFAGLGLGLSLVRCFAQSCGGTVALQSRELEGTSVALSLPVYRGEKPILACYDPSGLLTDRFSPVYVALSEVCRCPGV